VATRLALVGSNRVNTRPEFVVALQAGAVAVHRSTVSHARRRRTPSSASCLIPVGSHTVLGQQAAIVVGVRVIERQTRADLLASCSRLAEGCKIC